MKKKKISRVIKAVGMPLLALVSPLAQATPHLNVSTMKVGRTLVSTRTRSNRRSRESVFIDLDSTPRSESSAYKQPFNAFGKSIGERVAAMPAQKDVLDLLNRNSLLRSLQKKESTISGKLYPQMYADPRLKDHCHYSKKNYINTSSYTLSHKTTYTKTSKDSCEAEINGDWDDGAALFGGASTDKSVTDDATVFPFSDVTIRELYSDLLDVTIDIDIAAKGTLAATVTPFFDASGDGSYSWTSESSTDIQTALQKVEFTPASGRLSAGESEDIFFHLTMRDGQNNDASADIKVTVTGTDPLNQAPVISGTVADQAVNDNETVSPFSEVTISDNDADNVSLTVTLDTQAKGSFTTLSGFTDNGDGSYSFASDTVANGTTAIQGLVFSPTENRVALGETETTTFTITANDGTDTTSDSTTTVISTSVNVAPPAPELSSPETGTTVSSPVTLSWNSVVDTDGDTVTYWLSLCENDTFENCVNDPREYIPDATDDATSDATSDSTSDSAAWNKSPWSGVAHAADLNQSTLKASDFNSWVYLLVLIGGLSLATLSLKDRKRYLILLFLIFFGLANCGDGGDEGTDEGVNTGTGTGEMSVTIPGLISGRTYYWKVTAKDGNGGETDSEVFNFTVE